MKRNISFVLVAVIVLSLGAMAGARAADGTPPQDVNVPGVLTITLSVNTEKGDTYHKNGRGTGHSCTGANKDDGVKDYEDCWNNRSELRNSSVHADEGGASAYCWRGVGPQNPGPAHVDGIWTNGSPKSSSNLECSGNPSASSGRAYTGGAVDGVTSVGVAAGGAFQNGGCAQLYVQDDTSGNTFANAANTARGADTTDDDTDITICGGIG